MAEVKRLDPTLTTFAFIAAPTDVPAYLAAGTDIIRLWSNWLLAPGAPHRKTIDMLHQAGKQVWAVIGPFRPVSERGWAQAHARLIQAGVDGIVTDRPDLIVQRAEIAAAAR